MNPFDVLKRNDDIFARKKERKTQKGKYRHTQSKSKRMNVHIERPSAHIFSCFLFDDLLPFVAFELFPGQHAGFFLISSARHKNATKFTCFSQ